jgi:membrane-associated phospholipid phosphatase
MIFTTIKGLLIAYPILITISLLFSYFITHNLELLILAFFLQFSNFINYIIKNYVFKHFFGNKIPFLGRGNRPDGATDCGQFIDINHRESTTYGMPSGHAQSSALLCVYLILMILDGKYSKNIKIVKIISITILSFTIILSRIYFGCHTIQQVSVGSLLGILFGIVFYINKKILLKYI